MTNLTKFSSPLFFLVLMLLLGSAYRALALHWSGLNLYVDEAQYWTWAQALDWGYYSKPPVISALIAATTALFGDSELAVKSGALILYPCTTLVLYALARRLFDARTALWSALIFFTIPGVAFSSLIISTDVALFLFWTLACYGLLRACESNDWRWWLLVGAASGIGLLTKYTMGIFAVCTLLWWALTPEHRRQLRNPRAYLAALLAALIFAPNLVWNAQHGWPTFQHTAEISHLETDAGLHWDELGEFLAGQAAILGPLLFAAFVWFALRLRSWISDPKQRFLACFALPFLAIISAQALLGRANANWAAMAYASGTVWVVAQLLARQQRGLLIASLVLNLVIGSLAYHYLALSRLAGVELTRRTDPFKRVQGWDQAGSQVRDILAAHPGALLLTDERDLMSELRYYAHPESDGAVMWNPTGAVENHYQLTTTMADKLGREFIYVSRSQNLAASLSARFDEAQNLDAIQVPVVPGWSLDFQVWRLQGFRGYAPNAAAAP